MCVCVCVYRLHTVHVKMYGVDGGFFRFSKGGLFHEPKCARSRIFPVPFEKRKKPPSVCGQGI